MIATHARFTAITGRCVLITAASALSIYLAPQAARGNAVTEVDETLCATIRLAAPSPPDAARDIAMVGIAMYDAVNAATGLIDRPYSYSGNAVPGASVDAAAYAAGYTMLESLFPSRSSSLQVAATSAINNLGLDPTARNLGVTLGTNIATSFFDARLSDGSAIAQTPYVPGNQPGN